MMRKGELSDYPVAWVLREASREHLTGGIELHIDDEVTAVHITNGEVYLVIGEGEDPGVELDDSLDDAAYLAAVRAADTELRARAVRRLAPLLDRDEGWYFYHPLNHHPLQGEWAWNTAELLAEAERVRLDGATGPAPGAEPSSEDPASDDPARDGSASSDAASSPPNHGGASGDGGVDDETAPDDDVTGSEDRNPFLPPDDGGGTSTGRPGPVSAGASEPRPAPVPDDISDPFLAPADHQPVRPASDFPPDDGGATTITPVGAGPAGSRLADGPFAHPPPSPEPASESWAVPPAAPPSWIEGDVVELCGEVPPDVDPDQWAVLVVLSTAIAFEDLARRLGWTTDRLRQVLDTMVEDGLVLPSALDP
jgi:hypothetical protein